MDLNTMSNEQIIEFIAQNLEKKRIAKKITAEQMANKGGFSAQTFSNFLNKNTNIRIETLIQILRGLGELSRFQEAIEFKEVFSPLDSSTKTKPKRVKQTRARVTRVRTWGEDK